MWGKGLVAGLKVTWGHWFGKKETVYYPEERLPMTERFRGGHLVLDDKKCIACKLCAMGCPNAALDLTVSVDEEKKRHMDSYKHQIGRCMYCDLCIEACPVKALSWDKNYEGSSYFKEDMTYDAVVEAKNRRGSNE